MLSVLFLPIYIPLSKIHYTMNTTTKNTNKRTYSSVVVIAAKVIGFIIFLAVIGYLQSGDTSLL